MRTLRDFLHGACARRRQGSAFSFEVFDHFIDDFAQLGIKPNRVAAVNACNQIRTLADVSLVVLAPLDPFVKLVTGFHL